MPRLIEEGSVLKRLTSPVRSLQLVAMSRNSAKEKGGEEPLREIRRMVLAAIFSDDYLMERLVLKGGNALSLAYELHSRSSLDIDLSMESDFDDPAAVSERLKRALEERLEASDLKCIEFKFGPKPVQERPDGDPKWGGYRAEFKMIKRSLYDEFKGDDAALRRRASEIGPAQERKFKIDISKHEFCGKKESFDVEGLTVYVYTLPAIAVEKLRAICQQLPTYEKQNHKKPRARDFFDIYTILTRGQIDLTTPENLALFEPVFNAKDVPLGSLSDVASTKSFHKADWDSVTASDKKEFEFYFNYVLGVIERLQACGIK